jgi:choline dehydrogenase-like flavoprotein
MLPLSDEVFWHKVWQFGDPTARFGTKYRDTIVGAQNIHLYTYANVVDIKTNDRVSSVKELTAKNYAGKTFKVVAKQFVIACCSIQGTRLLLSSNSQAKQGLGNDHDLVGRYFMEHAEIQTAELWLKQKADLTLYSGTPKQMRAELALKPEAQQKMGVLNGIMSLSPLESAREIPAFIKTWTDDDPRKNEERVGEIYRKSSRGRIARKLLSNEYEAFRVTLRTEQAPNPLSRVTLDTERDELGMPRAILNWAFTDLDRRSMRQIYRVLGEQIGAAGIGRVKLTEELADPGNTAMPASTSGGWHHMGTTRMNEDPKKGVVDANCKVHGIDNLYIAGSSCFPTGGGVNPTFTLVALSLRLSQFLKDKTLAT